MEKLNHFSLMYFCSLGPLRWFLHEKNTANNRRIQLGCEKSLAQNFIFPETAWTIWQSQPLAASKQQYGWGNARNVHQTSWIFVPLWTYHTQAEFQCNVWLSFCKYHGWGALDNRSLEIRSYFCAIADRICEWNIFGQPSHFGVSAQPPIYLSTLVETLIVEEHPFWNCLRSTRKLKTQGECCGTRE